MIAASNLATAELLTDFVWVFLVGTVLIGVLHSVRLPSLLGFLFTGLIVGPAGFGLILDREAIEILAEIGIVVLMFTIGLEVSLAELGRMAKRVVGGGLLQIGLTTACVTGFGVAMGLAPMTALALGLIGSASSTALVLRLLGDSGELRTEHGQMSVSILLMQDFAVVALMLVLPMLAAGDVAFVPIALAMLEACAIAAGIVVTARFVFPWVLARVVDLRSREVFLLTSVVAVFGTAWLADAVGLSLALGAFLAGLVISESAFSHQMSAEVLPFRDVLNGLFFVSVGLLVEREVVLDNIGWIALAVVAAFAVKGGIVYVTARAFRLGHGASVVSAVSLAQVGEFALVLAQQATVLSLITSEQHGLVVVVAVATMMLTPFALPMARRYSATPEDLELPALGDSEELEDHVIVVGYGMNGRNVARALAQLGVGYVVVEMNRQTVETEKKVGVPIVYGDATRPALLHHLRVDRARALVACIADAAATREIVASAHHANPELLIIARTRFVAEIDPLHELGASSVVPEEFETSLELIARVMRAYGAAESSIHREKQILRSEHYRALVDPIASQGEEISEFLADVDVEQVRVGERAAGRSLMGLHLRRNTGATAIAVVRNGVSHTTPDSQFELCTGDIVVLVGEPAALGAARELLTGRRSAG